MESIDAATSNALWWRWTHGESGRTASSSHETAPLSDSKKPPTSILHRPVATPTTSLSNGLQWKPRTVRTARSRAVAVPAKGKTPRPSIPSRGGRDEQEAVASPSAFLFSTHEDKHGQTSHEVFWSIGKTRRAVPRKDRKSGKRWSSIHSDPSRAGATRDVFSSAQEDPATRGAAVAATMFAPSLPQWKLRASSHGKGDSFSAAKTNTTSPLNRVGASGTNVPAFPPPSPSVASTTSTASFSSQSLSSTVDPLVPCTRAVVEDCSRTREREQSKSRKRSIEGSFDGKRACHQDSTRKPSNTHGIMCCGSSSSSEDELCQLSSMDQSFCMEKLKRDGDGKLAKEEIYRQMMLGDYDLSSSPENHYFSPLAEEKGLPIEVRYQLPLALGTVNETSMECTICQLRYGIGDHIVTLPCQHFFHACCVDKWLWNHTSCPLCRSEVRLDQRSNTAKHKFTECSVVEQERIRRQMRYTSQHAGFRPVVLGLESELSRLGMDEESESEEGPSYLVCPTPHFAADAPDN